MALSKLQISTLEMASSLWAINAVCNVWFRLRKKIDLPEDASWHDYLFSTNKNHIDKQKKGSIYGCFWPNPNTLFAASACPKS
jgi:hypothetical protein